MSFLTPELMLLGLPLGWVLWRTTSFPSWRFVLRALALLALLAALGGLHAGGATDGRDIVVVVDRSRSMPSGSDAAAIELTELLRDGARPGDRLAVLAFGGETVLEHGLSDPQAFAGFQHGLDTDASHLADALDDALALIPENRPGSILLLSDGESHGAAPDDAARRAALRGVRLDVRGLDERASTDVAVDQLDLPGSVGLGERFQFAAWVRSDREVDAEWRLLRGEQVIARGTRTLRRGPNQLLFRDVAAEPGLATYRLVVEAEGDQVVENDRGLGVTRVEGRLPLLLVNATGEAGRLAAALRGAGLDVVVRAPDQLPDGDLWLEAHSGVILENVAAAGLGGRLRGLANQVRDLGRGLLVTGGQASFGVGGYYRSPLEGVLPVTMELRVEHRKMALAMAFVLDRSGSMAAGVSGGRSKMDLANAGTIEAMRLLGPIDEVTVIAVDSEPHVVVPLRPVEPSLEERVSGIQSMGGGIYTYNGLLAAAHALEAAGPANRHIVLFADAADAEQPGQYKDLLETLTTERNTTVSVIALGDESDGDATFLKDVALRGGGEIHFTTSAEELPRLFAQDTLLAARSAFVDVPTGTRVTGAWTALSPTSSAGPWITAPGYNLTYLHPEASAGVLTTDEYAAPVVATRQAGLGRSAAFTAQVDGARGIPDAAWPEAAGVLITLARWIVGTEPPARYFPSVVRDGREALVSVDVDRGTSEGEAADESLTVHLVAPDGTTQVASLPRVGADRFAARIPLGGEGVYRLAASTDRGEVLPMDPLAVPYSPEFAARPDPQEGLATLGRLARLGRGRLNPPVNEILAGERGGRGLRSMVHWAALSALVLLLGEILWRRWYEATAIAAARRRAVERAAADPGAVPAGREQRRTPVAPTGVGPKSGGPADTPAGGDPAMKPAAEPPTTSGGARPAGDAAPAAPSLDDMLRKAKQRGRRR